MESRRPGCLVYALLQIIATMKSFLTIYYNLSSLDLLNVLVNPLLVWFHVIVRLVSYTTYRNMMSNPEAMRAMFDPQNLTQMMQLVTQMEQMRVSEF